MPRPPESSRDKKKFNIEKPKTWNEILKQASAEYAATRPQKKRKKKLTGRRIDENSELARAVKAEIENVPHDRLCLTDTKKTLIQKLINQFPEREESTIRRRVTMGLADRKRLRELTDQDLAFRRGRRPADIHSLERFIRRIQERGLVPLRGAIAANKAGRPLPEAEINRIRAAIEAETKRIYATKAKKQPPTIQVLQPSQPRRSS